MREEMTKWWLYLARSQFAVLDKSGGMRCETPIAPQCQPTASDRQRSSAPARRRTKAKIVAAQGIVTGTVLFSATQTLLAADEPAATPYRPSVSTPAALSEPGWLEGELGWQRTSGGD